MVRAFVSEIRAIRKLGDIGLYFVFMRNLGFVLREKGSLKKISTDTLYELICIFIVIVLRDFFHQFPSR